MSHDIINDNYRLKEVIRIIYQKITARREQIEKEISFLHEQIKMQPAGKLLCAGNGKYVKWFVRNGKGKKYLYKKDYKVAEKLAVKNYFTLQLEDLLCEKAAIQLYLKERMKSFNQASALLSETSYYKPFLAKHFTTLPEELDIWENSFFESNPHHPEQLVHKTFSGRIVRSKSEVIIDNALTINKIPFRYEAALELGSSLIYPDFTIRKPQSGDIIYWEHFGMMDNLSYSNKAFSKMQLFTQNNILPSIQLITSFETKDCPLTVETVEKIIHFHLG